MALAGGDGGLPAEELAAGGGVAGGHDLLGATATHGLPALGDADADATEEERSVSKQNSGTGNGRRRGVVATGELEGSEAKRRSGGTSAFISAAQHPIKPDQTCSHACDANATRETARSHSHSHSHAWKSKGQPTKG